MFAAAKNTMKWPQLLALLLSGAALPSQGILNLASPQPCGKVSRVRSPRIIGGLPAQDGDFPWIPQVMYEKLPSLQHSGVHQCAGSLVTSRHVLTAAHCFRNKREAGLWRVNITSNPRDSIRIDQILVHPSYKWPRLSNDLAVLSLASAVQWTDDTSPICLPDSQENLKGEAAIAGWGNTEAEDGNGNPSKIDETVMCTGREEGGRDACKGDSGGGLIYQEKDTARWVEVGIISSGYKCGLPRVPGIYTRVATFSRWIQNQVS